MATYNGAKFVYKQIATILPQLGNQDELLISDDGSTDNTLDIAMSFNDKRIRTIRNVRQKGPVGNFENALMNALGDIIFLADQDDTWHPDKLKKHLKLHQEYDLVLSDAKVVNEKGDVVYESFFAQRRSKPGLINNLIRNSFIGCCMSFNKRILNYALPFPKKLYMHDWWIGLIAEAKGKVYLNNEQLVYYLRHENNASPTLGNSNYSGFKRLKNRLQLMWALFNISAKKW